MPPKTNAVVLPAVARPATINPSANPTAFPKTSSTGNVQKPIVLPPLPDDNFQSYNPPSGVSNFNNVSQSTSNVQGANQPIGYNSEKGEALAKAATTVKEDGGKCYAAVKKTIAVALFGDKDLSNGWGKFPADINKLLYEEEFAPSAFKFAELSDEQLKQIGFKRLSPQELSNIKSPEQIPIGSTLVYDKGQYGFSSEHGHIATNLGNGQEAYGLGPQPIKGMPSSVFVPV